jgi:hypothetical protein
MGHVPAFRHDTPSESLDIIEVDGVRVSMVNAQRDEGLTRGEDAPRAGRGVSRASAERGNRGFRGVAPGAGRGLCVVGLAVVAVGWSLGCLMFPIHSSPSRRSPPAPGRRPPAQRSARRLPRPGPAAQDPKRHGRLVTPVALAEPRLQVLLLDRADEGLLQARADQRVGHRPPRAKGQAERHPWRDPHAGHGVAPPGLRAVDHQLRRGLHRQRRAPTPAGHPRPTA